MTPAASWSLILGLVCLSAICWWAVSTARRPR